jgi:ParB family chromosome partitioning protein
MAQKIVSEGLSVRATEEAVALYQEPQEPRRSSARNNARHERLDFLASSLADRLDTNVKITLGARKGKVSIEFASVEDLNRIMTLISPEDD